MAIGVGLARRALDHVPIVPGHVGAELLEQGLSVLRDELLQLREIGGGQVVVGDLPLEEGIARIRRQVVVDRADEIG